MKMLIAVAAILIVSGCAGVRDVSAYQEYCKDKGGFSHLHQGAIGTPFIVCKNS